MLKRKPWCKQMQGVRLEPGKRLNAAVILLLRTSKPGGTVGNAERLEKPWDGQHGPVCCTVTKVRVLRGNFYREIKGELTVVC